MPTVKLRLFRPIRWSPPNNRYTRAQSLSTANEPEAVSESQNPSMTIPTSSPSREDTGFSTGSQPWSSAEIDQQESRNSSKVTTTSGRTMPCSFAMDRLVLDTNPLSRLQSLTISLTENRVERCFSFDEKPLPYFLKLKAENKSPVFMLKHIKHIRSLITVAEPLARPEACTSSERAINGSSATSATPPQPDEPNAAGQDETIELEVSVLWARELSLAGTTQQVGWLPTVEHTSGGDTAGPATLVASSSDAEGTRREMSPSTDNISYAFAMYPYLAEQEDEFDVVIGDIFVVISRARSWRAAQRDPTGSGVVDINTSKQGWVPSGCLLETNVPIAAAIAKATAAARATGPHDVSGDKTRILPLSIISKNVPGIALMDYKKKGEAELDLEKDDVVRIFKRYKHWSYVVKEEGADRGWVPSWFIGKVRTPSGE